jgi:hypothetical protein
MMIVPNFVLAEEATLIPGKFGKAPAAISFLTSNLR